MMRNERQDTAHAERPSYLPLPDGREVAALVELASYCLRIVGQTLPSGERESFLDSLHYLAMGLLERASHDGSPLGTEAKLRTLLRSLAYTYPRTEEPQHLLSALDQTDIWFTDLCSHSNQSRIEGDTQ